MKKYLFLAVIFATALFSSCQPEVDEVKGIVLNPSEVVLGYGQSIRLSVNADPKTAKLDQKLLTWTSSNEEVAFVQPDGTVYASEDVEGVATITVSYNNQFTASCVVTVTDVLNTLKFTSAAFLNVDTTVYGSKRYEIKSGSGETFQCMLAQCELWLTSEGFYISDDGHYVGPQNTAYIEVKAPFYYAPQEAMFVLGPWDFKNLEGDSAQVCKLGMIKDTVEYCKLVADLFTANFNEDQENLKIAQDALQQSTEGACMFVLEAAPEGGYYFPIVADGFVTEGSFILSEPSAISSFMIDMEYSSIKLKTFDEEYAFGVELQEEVVEDKYLITPVSNEIHWGKTYSYDFGTPSNALSAPKAVKANVMSAAQVERLRKSVAEQGIRPLHLMK